MRRVTDLPTPTSARPPRADGPMRLDLEHAGRAATVWVLDVGPRLLLGRADGRGRRPPAARADAGAVPADAGAVARRAGRGRHLHRRARAGAAAGVRRAAGRAPGVRVLRRLRDLRRPVLGLLLASPRASTSSCPVDVYVPGLPAAARGAARRGARRWSRSRRERAWSAAVHAALGGRRRSESGSGRHRRRAARGAGRRALAAAAAAGATYFDFLTAYDELERRLRGGRPRLDRRTRATTCWCAPACRATTPRSPPPPPVLRRRRAGTSARRTRCSASASTGNDDLEPLLLPPGFVGTPLRKDFVLAARVPAPWPGEKDPADSTGRARRRTLPPGRPRRLATGVVEQGVTDRADCRTDAGAAAAHPRRDHARRGELHGLHALRPRVPGLVHPHRVAHRDAARRRGAPAPAQRRRCSTASRSTSRLCLYCGICVEVCPFDALHWSPAYSYAAPTITDLTHERAASPPERATDPAAPADPRDRAASLRRSPARCR